MHRYHVLGGHLSSDLEFPELLAAASTSARTWTFTTAPDPAPATDLYELGSDEVRDAGNVRLFRRPGGFRLTYADTGIYDVLDRGARIVWFPPSTRLYDEAQFLEAVRIDVLGRVLSVALHAAGVEALHGSAVTCGDGSACAFVAPKFHGKSTLAATLVTRGARLVTDDTLPVLPGEPRRAAPGVHSVRLWEDAAERLSDQLPGLEVGPWGKLQSSRLRRESLVYEPVPLAAIYVLAPRLPAPGGPAPAIARERLAPIEAAIVLVAHAKIGALLGKDAAPALLAWAVELARAVPVYRLLLPRDVARLPEVVDRLWAWHSGAA
jgi:hypothetical protein